MKERLYSLDTEVYALVNVDEHYILGDPCTCCNSQGILIGKDDKEYKCPNCHGNGFLYKKGYQIIHGIIDEIFISKEFGVRYTITFYNDDIEDTFVDIPSCKVSKSKRKIEKMLKELRSKK